MYCSQGVHILHLTYTVPCLRMKHVKAVMDQSQSHYQQETLSPAPTSFQLVSDILENRRYLNVQMKENAALTCKCELTKTDNTGAMK